MDEINRDVEKSSNEAPAEEPSSRLSLTERLMRSEPVAAANPAGAGATAATASPASAATGAASVAGTTSARPASRAPEKRFAWNGGTSRVSSPVVDNMLTEARRFIRFRYFVFMASVAVLFALTVVSGVVFVASLLGDADWEQTAVSGAVAGIALFLLIALQYRPARSFGSAAFQVAQLEAARAHLNVSYELWERFIADKEEANQLSANDVATAVASLTNASRLIDIEEMARAAEQKRTGRGSASAAPTSFSLPSATMPDPRRF
jgi:hypothetical protein